MQVPGWFPEHLFQTRIINLRGITWAEPPGPWQELPVAEIFSAHRVLFSFRPPCETFCKCRTLSFQKYLAKNLQHLWPNMLGKWKIKYSIKPSNVLPVPIYADVKKKKSQMPTLKKYEPLFYFCFCIWLQTDSNNTRLNLAQAFQSYDNPKANYMLSLLTGVLRVGALNSITLVECQVFRKGEKKRIK